MNYLKFFLLLSVIIVLSAAFVFASPQKASLKLNSIFTDHMVLQRDTAVSVYGKAAAGSKVVVEIAGQTLTAKAGSKGDWSAKLQPIPAGGPYEMNVISGNETVSVKDILTGDVWFCSGQSNMEWILSNTTDGAEELKGFKTNPNIRLFLQEQLPAAKPLTDPAGKWAECDAENAKNFSAIAYFFANNLSNELKVPIGVIDSSWGGTSIEIWMDQNLLKGNPVTKPILDRWKDNPVFDWKNWNYGKGMNYSIEVSELRFYDSTGKAEPAYVNLTPTDRNALGGSWYGWAKPGSTAEAAAKAKACDISGIIGFNAWAGAGTLLKNGEEADLSKYDRIIFKVRGSGKFSVSLCQNTIIDYDYYSTQDFDAVKTWKDISVPIAALKQGGWGLAKPFTQNAIKQLQFNIKSMTVELPSALYNGMVMPYAKFPIKGSIWYQGENNANRALQYGMLLPMMIKNWRNIWNIGDFPFILVQLPNFMERKAEPGESEWAELRESQLNALSLTSTAVVASIDIGDPKDIHPRLKKPVSYRLAQAALNVAYGKDVVPMGPVYEAMKIDGNRITLSFKYTGKGLKSKDGSLKGFSIAGNDKKFVWANAEIKDDKVVVWSDSVREPASVRYAWADNPECNLYNEEGLAASPFRTDNWPGLTQDRF